MHLQKVIGSYVGILQIITILMIRKIMLQFKLPSFLYKNELFNSNKFAVSDITPSIGDLLTNSIFGLIIIIILSNQFQKVNLSKLSSNIILVVLFFVSILALYIFYTTILQIYTGSQFVLDLRLNTPEIGNSFKIASLSIFVIHSCILIIVQYTCLLSFARIEKPNFYILIFLSILIVTINYFSNSSLIPSVLMITHGLFWVIILVFDLKIKFKKYYYKSTVFLVVSAIFCAFVATYVDYTQEIFSDYTKKQQFGKYKLDETDPMGEFLIEVANESMKGSPQINKLLNSKPINFDLIDEEIRTNHFTNWFDKYDLNINYFDKNGQNLKNRYGKSFNEQWRFYVENGSKTLIENLYFIASGRVDKARKYIYKVKITANNLSNYDLIIVFNDHGNKINDVYDYQLKKPFLSNFDYFLFNANGISDSLINENSYGKKLIKNKDIFNRTLIINDLGYTAVQGQNGNIVLVYSPVLSKSDIFRSFSFLFVILLLVSIIGLVCITYFKIEEGFDQSYSGKIQVYFGLAFLIPLLISLLLIFNIINKSFKTKETQKFEAIAHDIKKEIIELNDRVKLSKENKYFWNDELIKFANDRGVDFSLFNSEGGLITTTYLMKRNEWNSFNLINQTVIKELQPIKNITIPYFYKSKDLKYFVYYQFLIDKNGIVLGILALPYKLNDSLGNSDAVELLGSIVSTFAIIFILFLLVSILISNSLIRPLKLITNYLQKTDINNSSEPLSWNTKDEIGLLVEGYNSMIAKIEEGKREISQNEKQIAWQDIAKQVAHEIKNPLTPMKLTLQHLENTLSKDAEIKRDYLKKNISNLIYNIDNISEIVDSFMAFARLPMPKNKKTDLLKPINAITDLYANTAGVTFDIDSKLKKAYISGDEKLLFQIINNLIINSLQSVRQGIEPIIKVSFTKHDSSYLIRIADNGIGISDDLKKKIFMPNFTTKETGLGIGLSLAKWGIENMDGQIWFDSTEGKGSTFFIKLNELNVTSNFKN